MMRLRGFDLGLGSGQADETGREMIQPLAQDGWCIASRVGYDKHQLHLTCHAGGRPLIAVPGTAFLGLSVSPDEKYLLYSLRRVESNILLEENVG